jgi:hypothetical protein
MISSDEVSDVIDTLEARILVMNPVVDSYVVLIELLRYNWHMSGAFDEDAPEAMRTLKALEETVDGHVSNDMPLDMARLSLGVPPIAVSGAKVERYMKSIIFSGTTEEETKALKEITRKDKVTPLGKRVN